MLLLTIGPRHRPHEVAFAESSAALELAERHDAVVAGAWILPAGPRICLGALQHAGRLLRTVSADTCRRGTSGAAAALDGGVLVTLALPSLDAIHRDATPRTVLNRNVRPILAGLRHAGVAATYLGRDFLSVARRPFALLGLDGLRSGAVAIEALMTFTGSLALPADRITDLEASTPRFRGASPMSLEEAGVADPDVFAARVLEGIGDRLGAESEARDVDAPALGPVIAASSPLGPSAHFAEPQPIPMGWLDLALLDGLPWIGGDALVPTYALGHSFDLGGTHVPMEGAGWDDVRRGATFLRRRDDAPR